MTAAGIRPSPWRRELSDLGRGVAGAFLFGVPFLYTMEVWWTGNFTSPPRMLVALALTYGALVALDAATGFRSQRSTILRRTLADSIEALALGLVCATAGLVLLRRLTPDVGLEAAMGRIVLLGLPFGIGVGVANGLLRRVEGEGDEQEGDNSVATDEPQGQDYSIHGTLVDGGAAVLGATVVALAIAPTEEVPLIAAGLSGPWLLAVILASLALSYVIVFEADFGSQEARRSHQGIFQHPRSETVFAYLLALLMAGAMLWLFQLVQPGDPPRQWVSYIVVLGLPAAIGGAAGRVAV